MGCMCNRKISIKSNLIQNNQTRLENNLTENINSNSKSKDLEKRSIKSHKYNEFDVKNEYEPKEKRKLNNVFTIQLKPMRVSSSHFSEYKSLDSKKKESNMNDKNNNKKKITKSRSIHFHELKRISTSMHMLKDIIFDPKDNVFDSLSKTIPTQNIIFNIIPDYNEIFFDIWIEKDSQIFFQVKTESKWGIIEKGLINYLGYEDLKNHKFNLCCLLMRVGNEKKYNKVINNSPYYSKFSGPLFMKMNISKKIIEKNNYNLGGDLICEIYNARKFSRYQIFKKLNFEFDDTDSFNIFNFINIFRKFPYNFINLFLATENLNNFNEIGINEFFIKDENLRKLCDIEIETKNNKNDNKNNNYNLIEKLEKIKGRVIQNKRSFLIQKIIINTDNFEPINIVKSLIMENKYKFIFESNLKYLGVSIKKEKKRNNNINNIKSCFIVSNLFI